MTSTFAEALKARAEKLNLKLNSAAPPEKLEVRVRLMLATEEIEVHFSRFPGESIIADLKKAGFRWNSTCWFAKDSEQKRAFCRARFNAAELEPFQETPTPAPVEPPKLVVRDTPVEAAKPDTSPFGIYKRQVDELVEYLHINPSDLLLLAMDKLHKATFSVN